MSRSSSTLCLRLIFSSPVTAIVIGMRTDVIPVPAFLPTLRSIVIPVVGDPRKVAKVPATLGDRDHASRRVANVVMLVGAMIDRVAAATRNAPLKAAELRDQTRM